MDCRHEPGTDYEPSFDEVIEQKHKDFMDKLPPYLAELEREVAPFVDLLFEDRWD